MKNFDFRHFLRYWVIPLGSEMIALILILNFVAVPTWVPTGSMIPTVDEGSVLITTKLIKKDELKRGEIISFDSEELDKLLIKRLVGLPGETVEVKIDGSVYINGEKLDEWYVVNQQEGVEKTFEVPHGHYLFFGDNRDGSYDARGWDDPYIPAEAVNGRGIFTLWPIKNFGILK